MYAHMMQLMWDFPLYAVNMVCYHWLIKKLLWPVARVNKARWEIQSEIQREVGGVKKSYLHYVDTEGEGRHVIPKGVTWWHLW